MNKQIFLKAALLISFMVPSPVSAQTTERRDGMRFVPNVPDQFKALTERADALGLHRGNSTNPTSCRHYQGLVRVDGADGTPFLLVTRSGNTPETFGDNEANCIENPGGSRNGNLIVFRLGSRDKNGERLRSNRLSKGAHVNDTIPPVEDMATIHFTVVGGDPSDPDPAKRPGLVVGDDPNVLLPRVYGHPGGMQLVGKILAMAVESPRDPNDHPDYEVARDPVVIMFFDVSNPENPVFRSQYIPITGDGLPRASASFAAITPLPAGPDGRELYLMVTAGGAHNRTFFFYRSTIGDLSSPELSWDYFGSIPGPDVEDAHQTLNFLREGNIYGDLYLAGSRGHVDTPFISDRERIDLYRVQCETPDCVPGQHLELIPVFNSQRITTRPSTGGEQLASLAAASGFYVTPSGELILYATEHDNDGPNGTIKAGEWRHINMVRENSPTLRPSAAVNGPYEVDEGSSVVLSGTGGPPITKAWIQLFHERDFGGVDFATFYPVVDYDDYELDDFDNFFALEFQPASPFGGPSFTHGDKARSIKWFAPIGCSIRVTDRRENRPDETKTLVGDGLPHEYSDLSQVFNDAGTDDMAPSPEAADQGVDAVEFLPGCNQYYTAPVGLFWDLDVNGSFETTGSQVTFSAFAFDGPSEVGVPAEARHPLGGPAGQAIARVRVRNVAPLLSQFRVTDGAGNQVNVDAPFVLTGLPVTVGAGFSDPGVLDHQTATLAWGDGSVDPNTVFTIFDEAFGDGSGVVSHTHIYNVAGSYPLALSVTDDDGGADSEATVVRVVTPEQAVEEIIGLLDDLIASTTDNGVREDLEKARQALAGSNDQSNNGALNMIRAGNDEAAIAFLQQAITWLQRTQAGAVDVATQIALLEQVIAALSAA